MLVAMMQPSFLPWLGYFELILRAERFIFLDDFQFSIQSYHQRNRLFVNRGQVDWYTVPIYKSNSLSFPLNETRINETTPWRKKQWLRIEQNYSKAPFYSTVAHELKRWYFSQSSSLATQNIELIMLLCSLMGIEREFLFSSDYPSNSKRSERVLELLKWSEASKYLCARGSFSYMKEDGVFPIKDVTVDFQNFAPKEYYQVGSPQEFIPYLSVLDALMNIGPDATLHLIAAGTESWSSWDEMCKNV